LSKLLFPAPDGPIMTESCPCLNTPDTPLRSLICAGFVLLAGMKK